MTHTLQKGYLLDVVMPKGKRYFKVQYCTACKHYDVLDITYTPNTETFKIIKLKDFKPYLSAECPGEPK